MNILKNWYKEIMSVFVFLRFKNIWRLRDYLTRKNKTKGICASVYTYYLDKKGSYIGLGAKIANQPYFPHNILGVFISEEAKIGSDAVIFQQVTIGSVRTRGSKKMGGPTIGNNCYIGAGAKIIGNIKIGNNCRIGANAVVYEDMPDNSVAVSSPTRIIKNDHELDNRFFVMRSDGHEEYYQNGSFHTEE